MAHVHRTEGVKGLKEVRERVQQTLQQYETFTTTTNDAIEREVLGNTADARLIDSERDARVRQLAEETKEMLNHLTTTEMNQARALEATLDRLQHIQPLERDLLEHADIALPRHAQQRLDDLARDRGMPRRAESSGALVKVDDAPVVLDDLLTSARQEKGHTRDSLETLCRRTMDQVAALQAQLKEQNVDLVNARSRVNTLEAQVGEYRGQGDRFVVCWCATLCCGIDLHGWVAQARKANGCEEHEIGSQSGGSGQGVGQMQWLGEACAGATERANCSPSRATNTVDPRATV